MPTTVRQPSNVFVSDNEIPADMRYEAGDVGLNYLVAGEVRSWSGPSRAVHSPVCVSQKDDVRQVQLGHYPLMTEKESLIALEAACRAYGNGRGEWPTMSVSDRIRCVESFIPRMQAQREQVVKLLMWEIGKTLPDARKEFDRTVDYIRATVDALKDLDRTSSRFVLEPGFLAQIRRSPLGVCAVHGALQLPAQRDVHHADPGPHHG